MLIWQMVLIQIVTFALIIAFLRWLLYSNIRRVLKRLQHLNRENLEREKVLKEEMEKARKEAQRMIDEARTEAEAIKEEARAAGEKDREEIILKAREESKRLVSEAVKDCRRKEMEADMKMKEQMIYAAVDIVKRIFTQRGKEALHNQIVDELLEEIEGIEKEKIRVEGNEARVICAIALDSEQKKKIKKILIAKFNKEVNITEEVDPGIVAGLVLRLERFVVDGSLSNKLKKVLPLIKEKAKEA